VTKRWYKNAGRTDKRDKEQIFRIKPDRKGPASGPGKSHKTEVVTEIAATMAELIRREEGSKRERPDSAKTQ
jgi:hypothetical protein